MGERAATFMMKLKLESYRVIRIGCLKFSQYPIVNCAINSMLNVGGYSSLR